VCVFNKQFNAKLGINAMQIYVIREIDLSVALLVFFSLFCIVMFHIQYDMYTIISIVLLTIG